MNPRRRQMLRLAQFGIAPIIAPLSASLAAPAPPPRAADDARSPIEADDPVRPGRPLRFPRDHGAHTGARIEWWYATGWLDRPGAAPLGFQVTFFRQRTDLATSLSGRFAPRQMLFAHAALSDISAGRHRHAQRVARWSGDETNAAARATLGDTDVSIGRWRFARSAQGGYRVTLAADEAAMFLDLTLQPRQPLLLQGDHGSSQKGPLPTQMSHYYSEPQLAVRGRVRIDGQTSDLAGTGWLDHEWSESLMPPGAVGWDWIGMNLRDGAALTAFRLRDRAGEAVWAGGSFRPAGGSVRTFEASEVHFIPLLSWTSPATGSHYPVRWRIETPAGSFEVRALMDAQELDSRASTASVYWEGLSDLLGPNGTALGRGYLEMTGYVEPLRLG